MPSSVCRRRRRQRAQPQQTYAGDFQPLKNINFDIRRDKIVALLGPNGAGKTLFISFICWQVKCTGTTTCCRLL
ncbi:MAG: hypothetical protein CVU22_21795 [Betaproteobacteria bacterium HGW-Betaproteobacteria-16]|nr:MAG: hypothetical protein CVU22_21795 [Betaproteobacteria bacterium HGW-Betaproteobacteria-16]